MLNPSDSNRHVFLLYINVMISYSFKVKIGNHKELNFVHATILEISQDALHVHQTHRVNVFLLNIHPFKLQKLLKNQDNLVF